MTDTVTNNTAAELPSDQLPEQPAPSLTLQDLVFVAQVIQLTSQRGAFRAEELANVGLLYNKLVTFLQSTGAVAPAQTTEENQND